MLTLAAMDNSYDAPGTAPAPLLRRTVVPLGLYGAAGTQSTHKGPPAAQTNLQADIMLGDARMLALVRHRGYITLHRDEFSDTRITSVPLNLLAGENQVTPTPGGPLVPGTLASCAPAA